MNSTTIQFTRYLYNKQYCKTALTLSMLNKDIDQSLFWGYELLFSGFKNDVYDCLLTIFYQFYYILNASYEKYLLDMIKQQNHEYSTIYFIIVNKIKRHYTTDVFMLNGLSFFYEEEDQEQKQNPKQNQNQNPKEQEQAKNKTDQILQHFIDHEYLQVAVLLLSSTNVFSDRELIQLFTKILDYYITQGFVINYQAKIKDYQTLLSSSLIMPYKKIILLSRLFHLKSLFENKKQGKPVYIRSLPTENELYPFYTQIVDEGIRADQILQTETKYSINDIDFFSTFYSEKDDEKNKHAYLYHWEYYAFNTPVWKERFDYFGAIKDDINQTIQFPSNEKKDEFYYLFGYQPEEQSSSIQYKSILKPNSCVKHLIDFYDKYSLFNIVPINKDLLYL
jgi:hypothetical protein